MVPLYLLRSELYSTTFKATPEIANKWVKDRVPIPGYEVAAFFIIDLGLGNYPKWLEFPVVYCQYGGKKIWEMVETPFTQNMLISDNLKDSLDKESLTGWGTYPILLLDKKGKEISGFHGLSITGRGGDYEVPFGTPTAEISSLPRENRVYDIRQWDRSDLFTIGKRPYVSERAMKFLKTLKIPWLYFDPIEDYLTVVGND